jgi:hypothetical protein
MLKLSYSRGEIDLRDLLQMPNRKLPELTSPGHPPLHQMELLILVCIANAQKVLDFYETRLVTRMRKLPLSNYPKNQCLELLIVRKLTNPHLGKSLEDVLTK